MTKSEMVAIILDVAEVEILQLDEVMELMNLVVKRAECAESE